MSHDYKLVTWTPFKKRFDRWLLVGIALYLIMFVAVSTLSQAEGESFTPIQILIRATGTLAFGLLSFILCIGPLARLSRRFKPLLYNRRHLGVTTFLIALAHAGLVILWYHGFSDVNPLVSVLASNPRYTSISGFPFESLGVIALLILFLMATTSHDFWNANLGPGLWKVLHMGVYLAYSLLVAHIALGAIQLEKSPIYVLILCGGAGLVSGLHLLTGIRSLSNVQKNDADGWLKVAAFAEMENFHARTIHPKTGEAIAVFRNNNEVVAVSNVCRHQGGPLGEGRIVNGEITCPWHGFQYQPGDGCSPAPFTEKIATYATRIENGIVYVSATPNPPGTPQASSISGEKA